MAATARKLFARHPFVVNCLTYGTLYVGAEFSQQLITRKMLAKPTEDIDTPTLGRYAIMGTFIYSPTLYTWYKWLDGRFPGTAQRIIVKKLVLDQFLLTPVLLVMFYTGMSLMERVDDPFQELKQKFAPTFLRSCIFWIPAQFVNFTLVSPNFRVIYVGACAFAWVNILCWIKRQRFAVGTNGDREEANENARK